MNYLTLVRITGTPIGQALPSLHLATALITIIKFSIGGAVDDAVNLDTTLGFLHGVESLGVLLYALLISAEKYLTSREIKK